ncbi:Ig-like domain-containing protein [Nostoc sp. TCL26-01]|uniref:Ig-like domain-containing protein n=1 Tax=Nostoc sp. TCL26-01 TaxID=2576904 RepID=UPI0015B87ABC|nr:Ig-like domain-containing protein [Nostoc sp. TCL26-01]QLE56855.1 choice-of-anchor D domain-containing protein [Nostoc sp. TCL26-01]
MEDFQNISNINANNILIPSLLTETGSDLFTPQILGKNSLSLSFPTIPFIEDGFLKGDANNDGGLTYQDLDLILKDRNKPIVGINDPRDFDGDKKITIFDVRKLGLEINFNRDKTPPNLSAALANDTGVSTDKITADIAIKGTVKDASRITRIRAGIDNTTIDKFTNIRGVVANDGTFILTAEQLSEINNNTPLTQGQHTLHLFAKDQWNNTSTFDLTFTLDSNSPIISASLSNDTGSSNNDQITKDATITGSIKDLQQIVSFQAGFDNTATANFVDILGTLKDQNFTLNQNKITEINGSNLSDGSHTLKLIATDIAGNTANLDYTFTVDTTRPQIPGLMLDSLFDSAPVGDSQTKFATVSLIGQTEANTTVLLQQTSQLVTADATGKFIFTGVALTLGDNSFTAIATDKAGNQSTFTEIVKRVTEDNSDVVLDWNTILLNAIYTDKTAPPRASRNMAIAQTAVFDAINSITKNYQNYYFTGVAPVGASPEAAAAAAAHRVLVNLYPGQITFFDAALTESLAEIPDGAAEDAGVIFGRTVADSILTLRGTDGSSTTVTYTPGTNPGDWIPTAPGFAPALLPQWGQVTPFGLTSGSQFRPEGPPALDSQQYTDDYNQVKDLGKKNSTTRTAEQTQIALFWADGGGTFTPPGHWNQIAQNVVASKGNSLVDNARIFALLDISIADAGIAAWDAKYHYNFWRPITAIQKGDTDGNPNTIADPNWTPLITTPPFPDYISGHSTFSGAATTILTALLGDNVNFTVNSLGLPGVYRQFNSFSAAADEAAISRLYGGIHFNTANVDGLATGKLIGNYVLQNLLAPVADNQPPIIGVSLLNDTGNSGSDRTTSDSTIKGTVTDTSQIVKFQAKLNSGSFVDVLSKLNTDGSFTLDKATLTQINGGQLADGVYQLSLKAEDKLGNVSGEVKLEFTLDTTKPAAPTELKIKDDIDTITNKTTPTITGKAETGSLVQIFDGQTKLGETTATNGTWEITTSQLTDGVKNFTVNTIDAAGNISDKATLQITVDTVAPLLTVTSPQANAELKSGDKLTGSVNENTAQVSYRFNNGSLITVPINNQGRFDVELNLTGLADGQQNLTLRSVDLAGNSTETTVLVTIKSTTSDTTPPVITAALSQDTGIVGDRLTSNPAINGKVSDTSKISTFRAGFDNTQEANFVNVLPRLQADGSFAFNLAQLETIKGSTLGQGQHLLKLVASDELGNKSSIFNFDFTLDSVAAIATVASTINASNVVIDVDFSEAVTDSAIAKNNYTLKLENGQTVAISSIARLSTNKVRLNLTAPLASGKYTLTIDPAVSDLAGNGQTRTLSFTVNPSPLFQLVSHTPMDGATEVGVTFRPQIFFSEPVDPTSLNSNNFFASFGGEKIAATIVPANDGQFAWLFFQEPLPDASLIRVTVDGSTIRAKDGGKLLDADGDGQASGVLTFDFNTVSLVPTPNTSLSGIITDPGVDRLPHTADDQLPGPDGVLMTADDVFLNPIAGVKVFILGRETDFRITGADGRFSFDSVPVGNVKLAIDGRTATAPPTGFYFPEMVMDVNISPGVGNFTMMGMPEVYLPRIPNAILKDVDASQGKTIVADAVAAPELTAEQQQYLTIEVQPNSLVSADGQKLTSGQIGISTVPPELVRDMLPPGVLQHTFDITVQSPGITNFATPAPMTFPNVFGAAPGTQLNFLSFDHTTGRLVIEGTATVSEDGKFVRTDPGTGITHPGWHGLTPPGSCGGSGGAPPPPPPPPSPKDTMHESELVIPLITGESGSFLTKTWTAPDKLPDSPPPPPPTPGCAVPQRPKDPDKKQPYIQVNIQVEGPLADFMKQRSGTTEPLTGSSFTLQAGSGEKHSLEAVVKSYVEMAGILGGTNSAPFSQLNENILFGSKILITEVTGKPDGSKHTEKTTYYLYRFIDATDADHNDKQIEFEDTLVNGTRTKPISLKAGSATPQISASGAFSASGSTVQFKPTSVGLDQSGTLTIKTPTGKDVGTLNLKGDGEPKQKWFVDVSSFFNPDDFTDAIENTFSNDMTTNEKLIFGTANTGGTVVFDAGKASAFINDVIAEAAGLLNPFSAGLERVTSSSSGTVDFDDWEAESLDLFDDKYPTLGSAFIVDNENGQYNIDDIYTNRTKYSTSEQNFRLSEALNENYDGHVDIYFNRYFQVYGDTVYRDEKGKSLGFTGKEEWTRDQLVKSLGKTIAHELGHNVGLNHTNNFNPSDVMAQGFVLSTQKSFTTTANALKIALGLPWSDAEGQQAVQYYSTYITKGKGDAPEGISDPDSQPPKQIADGLLWLLEDGSQNFIDAINFGNVNLTGSVAKLNFVLTNTGDQLATINNISLTGNTGQFTLSNFTNGLVLAPGANTPITISFDPSVIGKSNATLVINSDALQPVVEIPLTGFAQSTNPYLFFNTPNNNLGGVAVAGGKVEKPNLATITNYGNQPLSISDIKLVEGSSAFSLLGVANNLATNPISLNFGESWSFGVDFDPSNLGLDRAVIEITSNDSNNSKSRFSFVGTGLDQIVYPQWGNDFIAIETPDVPGAPVLRTVSDDKGNFQLFLPPEQAYHMTIFDPVTGLVSHSYGKTPQSGQGIDLTASIVFNGSKAADTDGDGLPDDIEFAIGTDLQKIDTNNDGVSDFAAIQQGIDALGVNALPIGIISTVKPQQNNSFVQDVVASDKTAYLAAGSGGVQVVDLTQITKPVIISSVSGAELSGNAIAVAYTSIPGTTPGTTQHLVAAALGGSGLAVVDVTDPPAAKLLGRVSLSGSVLSVTIVDNYVYAGGSNGQVTILDVQTREIVGTFTATGSGDVSELTYSNGILYTLRGGTLATYNLGENLSAPALLNSLAFSGATNLFVGGDRAYVTGARLFEAVDITDPTKLKNTSGDSPILNYRGLAVNGSGRLIVGSTTGFSSDADARVTLFNVDNPDNTNGFLTEFDTPGSVQDIWIQNGLALVADGTGGLAIFNYLPFDNKGQAPNVTISTSAKDSDLTKNGIQVVEGTTIPILAKVTDDVQVRNVDLLVNGEVVENDGSFPWDLFAIAPKLTAQSNKVTLQVRATDTGGNTSLSNILTLDLIKDTFAPTVISTTPNEGARLKTIPSVSVRFNEALDTSRLNLSGVKLTYLGANGVVGGGDDVLVNLNELQTRNLDRTLLILPGSELSVGNYQLKLEQSIISDRAGNALTTPITLNFTKRPLTSPLTLGGVITGNLAEPGDDEVYTFTGTAGQRILFDGLDNNFTSIYTQLQSPSGISLGNYYYYNDSQPFTLTETGTYRATVRSSNNATGNYSFQLLDASAAPTITLGTTVTDTLTPGLATEVYRINGIAGQRLFFDSLATASGANWTLYNSGNQYVTAANLSSDFETTLTNTGTYLLVLDGNNTNGNVNYSFKVTNPPTTSTALTLGNTVTSTISQPGEIDEYTFTGTAGQRLYYDALINNNTSTIYAQLISPSGQQVFYNGDADSDRTPLTLTETGTYKLILDGYLDNTGDYNFRLLDASAAPIITLDTTVTNTLTPGLESDIYRINGTAGQRLFFNSLTNTASAFWTLYGVNNQYVTNTNLASDFEVTLTNTGTYLLVLDGYNSNSNTSYSFKVTNPPTTSTALTLGNTVTSTISQPGEIDEYTFTGTAGQRLYYDGLINNNTSTIYAQLISPSGQQVFYNGDADSDRTPLTLTETGTYKLILDGYLDNTGDYSFRLLDASAAPIITLDTTVTNTLTPGLEADIYRINGTAGQRLFFNSLTTSASAFWTLYGVNNQYITSFNLASDFEVTLTNTGTYLLVLDGYNSNGNTSYSFKVTNSGVVTTTALTLGNTVSSTISQPGETDEYTFTGTAGQRLYYDGLINNNTSTIYAQLISPSGQQVFYNGDADSDRQLLTLTETGTYKLILDGYLDNTGDYSFRLLDASAAPTITLDTTVTNTLNPGLETDIYRINGNAGQKLRFDALISGSVSGNWTLYGTGNQYITGTNLSNDFEVTLQNSGTYLLVLDGYNSSGTVNYNFKVTDISDAPVAASGFNSIKTGTIAAGGQDTYTFTASAGLLVYFDGQNSNSNNITAELRDANNQYIFASNTNSDTQLIRLQKSGTYTLTVKGASASSTGSYRFQVIDIPAAATDISFNTPITRNLTNGAETVVYRFTGTPGQELYYDALQGDADTVYAQLISPSGTSVFYINSDSDRTLFTLNESGTYYLLLQGNSTSAADYSFRLLDASAATAVTLNSTITDTLTPGLATNIYRINGTAGQRLFFDSLATGSSANWTLYGIANQYITANNLSSDFEATLSDTGTYLLVLDGYSNTTVNYSFKVTNPPTTSTALTLGNTVTSTISQPGETDEYTFTGTAGQRLYYDGLINNNTSTIYAQLISPSGQQVFYNGDADSDRQPFTLTETGTYKLILDGNANNTGDYSFRLLDASAAPTITLDTTVTNTLTPGLEADIYRINGTAGQRLFFDALANAASASWTLYGPSNQYITGSNLASDLETTLPSTGTYLLVLDGFNSNANVGYSFKVTNPPVTTTALTLGNTVTSTISQPGEIDEYTFTGTAGQRLYYDGLINNNTFTIYAQLFSPSEQSVFYIDADSDRQPITLTETGTYKLILDGNGNNTGDYSFRLLDASAATVITLDTTITNTLTPGLETDIYRINGTAGQRLFFDSLANAASVSWTLYGAGNQYIAGSNLSTDFDATLTTNGTYLLVLNGFNNNTTVNYSFKVTNPPVTTTALTLGNTVTSTISQPGETDEYTFTGTAGQGLYYDGLINNNTFTIYAQLVSPSGQQIFYIDADSDRQPFTLIETGTYKLIVSGNGNNTGDYSFRLLDASSAPVLTLDTTVTNTLNPGLETDIYRITGKAGQQLRFDSLNSGFVSASWTLYNPGNQYVTSLNLSSDFVLTLANDGIYLLVLDGFLANGTINYRFQVSNA